MSKDLMTSIDACTKSGICFSFQVPSPEPQTEEVLPEAEVPVVDETWESKEIEDATKSGRMHFTR